MMIKKGIARFVLGALWLTACGGGTDSASEKTVTVMDNGEDFTYTTSSNFQAQVMDSAQLVPLELQMFEALNAERGKGGNCYNPETKITVANPPVAPLVLEKRIYQAARQHAQAMVAGNFSGHFDLSDSANKTPTRRMVNAGYKPLAPYASSKKALFFEESLAYGHLTPAEVLHAWESESFSHCMSIYVDLTYGAIAVADGNDHTEYSRYWVLNLSGEKAAE